MGPDGNLETGWGGGWVVDELFVHVPRDTVGVRNDEKRHAIHTLGAVHRLQWSPVDAVDGRCGKLQLLVVKHGQAGGGRRLQTNAKQLRCCASVTCMLHVAAHFNTATLPQSSHSTPISTQAFNHVDSAPEIQNQKHAGAAQHNAQA